MFKYGLIRAVMQHSGLNRAVVGFVVVFLLCSVLVWLFEPAIPTLGDSMWYCFEIVSTIGFGDITVSSPLARVVSVLLSVTSVFVVAVLTGAVVSYSQELMHARKGESVAVFIDRLEHLPDLSRAELQELSDQIKRLRKRNGNER